MHHGAVPRLSPRLSLFFLSLLAACGEGSRTAAPPVPARESAPAQVAAAPAAGRATTTDYQREAAALDSAIDNAVRFIDQQKDNTLAALETVALYVERARLTGNYGDYAKAETLLDGRDRARRQGVIPLPRSREAPLCAAPAAGRRPPRSPPARHRRPRGDRRHLRRHRVLLRPLQGGRGRSIGRWSTRSGHPSSTSASRCSATGPDRPARRPRCSKRPRSATTVRRRR